MINNIELHPNFIRNYRKRTRTNKKLLLRVQERIEMFRLNTKNPLIQDHPLTGSRSGFRSFSVTGDIRIIYSIEGNRVTFYDIGSHNQVY